MTTMIRNVYIPIYSRYQQEPPLPHYLTVAWSALCPREALLHYLIWLEGGCSYSIGLKRGTHVNYPIVETKHHYYFKRNNVLTFVRKLCKY